MQITQGASLDTLQLLSSKEVLQAFKVGQILKVRVIEGTPPERGGGRALLEIAGRQHEVRSLVPLTSGQQLSARLQAVGNRVLLQPVASTPASSTGSATLPPASTDEPAGIQRLLQTALRTLLPRQQPVHAVLALTQAIREHPDYTRLPKPIQQQVQRLLDNRPDNPQPDGRQLRAAVERAGIFFEANLAQNSNTPDPPARDDLKGQLFRLMQLLHQTGVSSTQAEDAWQALKSSLPTASNMPGLPVSPAFWLQPLQAGAETADMPLENLLKQWFQLASGALARTTVQQVQQLQQPQSGTQVDLPWITPWGVLPVQITIENEAQPGKPNTESSREVWRLTLAVTLPRLGEVQALLELERQQLQVQLWAGHPPTRRLLQHHQPRFARRVQQLGLTLTGVHFRATPVLQAGSADTRPPRGLLDMKA